MNRRPKRVPQQRCHPPVDGDDGAASVVSHDIDADGVGRVYVTVPNKYRYNKGQSPSSQSGLSVVNIATGTCRRVGTGDTSQRSHIRPYICNQQRKISNCRTGVAFRELAVLHRIQNAQHTSVPRFRPCQVFEISTTPYTSDTLQSKEVDTTRRCDDCTLVVD